MLLHAKNTACHRIPKATDYIISGNARKLPANALRSPAAACACRRALHHPSRRSASPVKFTINAFLYNSALRLASCQQRTPDPIPAYCAARVVLSWISAVVGRRRHRRTGAADIADVTCWLTIHLYSLLPVKLSFTIIPMGDIK